MIDRVQGETVPPAGQLARSAGRSAHVWPVLPLRGEGPGRELVPSSDRAELTKRSIKWLLPIRRRSVHSRPSSVLARSVTMPIRRRRARGGRLGQVGKTTSLNGCFIETAQRRSRHRGRNLRMRAYGRWGTIRARLQVQLALQSHLAAPSKRKDRCRTGAATWSRARPTSSARTRTGSFGA